MIDTLCHKGHIYRDTFVQNIRIGLEFKGRYENGHNR